MISALATTPILVISMDPYFDQDALLKSVSDPLPAVESNLGGNDVLVDDNTTMAPISDAAKDAVDGIATNNKLSDVAKIERRIPIPITDTLWDIEYVTGNSSSYNDVTPMDLPQLVANTEIDATEERIRKVITVGRQTVNLTFRVKSEVMALSSLRDVLDYVGLYKPVISGAVTHVSFYSPTLCIFDAILVGYTKSHAQNTDIGQITLSLELVDELKIDPIQECINLDTFFENFDYSVEAPDKKKGPKGEVTKEGDSIQIPGSLGRQTETTMNVLKNEDVYGDYTWYLISDSDALQDIPVPAYSDNRTIHLNKFTTYRCLSRSYDGVQRDLQGVKWLDKNISLESNVGGKFWNDIALCRVMEEENNPLNKKILLLFGVR